MVLKFLKGLSEGSGKSHAAEVMNQIFTIFDKDGSGCLEFAEFLLATSMTWTGTVEQKLRWVLKELPS